MFKCECECVCVYIFISVTVSVCKCLKVIKCGKVWQSVTKCG